MKNEGLDFIRSVFKFSISTWINFAVGLLTTIVLTRVFLPEVYAVVNLFNSTSLTLMSILCFGLDSAYLRFFYTPPNDEERSVFTGKLLGVSLFCSLIVGTVVVLFFSAPFTEYFLQYNYNSRILAVLLFISTTDQIILRYSSIAYRMDLDTKRFTTQAIVTNIIKNFAVLLALPFSSEIKWILSMAVVVMTIQAMVYLYLQRTCFFPSRPSYRFDGYKDVFKFAIFTAPTAIIININSLLTKTIIGTNVGLNAVGIYVSSFSFSAVLTVMKGGFGTYWAAYMYKNYKNKQRQIQIVHELIMFGLIIAFAILIAAKDIIYLLIGSDYHESKQIFSLVILSAVLLIAMETTIYGMSIRLKMGVSALMNVIYVVLNLILCGLWTVNYGIHGAAYASAVSSTIFFITMTIAGQHYYKSILHPWKTGMAVCMLLILAVCGSILYNSGWLYVILVIICVLTIIMYNKEAKRVTRMLKMLITELVHRRKQVK